MTLRPLAHVTNEEFAVIDRIVRAFPRGIGVLTTAYGLAIAARPNLFARPCGLTDDHGDIPKGTKILITAVGLRDAASGLAVACAPTGRALQTALAVRIAADTADAVLLGTTLPTMRARRKAAAVAGTWGAINAASVFGAR